MSRLLVTAFLVCATAVFAVGSPRKKAPTPRPTPREKATDFCREQAAARLKYVKTVEWEDMSKEEEPGTWLISGLRTAKSPTGNVDQQYTCRVAIRAGAPALKMIQLFHESTKSGKDVFEVYR